MVCAAACPAFATAQAQSKPMLAILDRLKGCGEFEIVIFGDKVIVEDPITEWPRCDCLLSWHSDGFPLKKVCMHKHLIQPLH